MITGYNHRKIVHGTVPNVVNAYLETLLFGLGKHVLGTDLHIHPPGAESTGIGIEWVHHEVQEDDVVGDVLFRDSNVKQNLAAAFSQEEKEIKILVAFALLSIFIACMGLFGMASFTVDRRVKEIGLRKVMGASAAQIVLIMFREIFFLIVLAIVVAIPVSLYFINMWLGNFAYKTGISPVLLAATAIGAILVAFLTASYHSIKVAHTNPADNLRYE